MKRIDITILPAVLLGLGALAGCQQQSEQPVAATPTEPAAAAAPEAAATPALVSGIDESGFDTSVRIQDDLFEAVNGTWVKNVTMPPDRARTGSFIILRDKAEEDVRKLVEEVSGKPDLEPGSPAQKIRDFYNAYMDAAKANEQGISAIAPDLASIDAVQSQADLVRQFSELGKYGVDSPIGGYVFSDSKHPDTNVVWLAQSGLTLPDRDYYLKDDDSLVKSRQLYLEYATGLLQLAGREHPADRAEALLKLETRLAEAQWPKEDNRNPDKTYNPMSLDELRELAPDIDWDASFEAAGIAPRDKYIVRQPSFFTAAGKILQDTDLDTWKDYLTLQTIDNFAPLLGDDSFDLWFKFHRAGLQGIEEPRPRWKRAVNAMNANLGELLGQLYVERYFKPAAKARMETMIHNLIAAYRKSISELDWMSEATKQQALNKLSKFNPKIGYPDQWRDYSKLEVVAGDAVGNAKRAAVFEYNRNVDKLDRPVDKNEWFMTPQTVNAYYNPAWNEIVFPASILQPPLFNVEADDAVNYGGIGAVIGHEIGHGFDDQGRKYDGDGNLRDWWTAEDSERFLQRKEKLAAQYNGYEVIDGMTINGEFTSGENIGDLGGLTIAHLAWQMSLGGKESPVIDGWTGEQRFFLGWAQVWRAKARPEETKRLLTIDPHSPPRFRANGAAVNVPAFYTAFDVKEGDGMYLPPEDRVKIW